MLSSKSKHELHGGLQIKPPVRSFRIVPYEPGNHLPVERRRVDKRSGMIVNELLLNGAVESFAVGIHLGGARIGMIMGQVQSPQLFVKMLHELRAVVSQYEGELIREYHPAVFKELLCGQ